MIYYLLIKINNYYILIDNKIVLEDFKFNPQQLKLINENTISDLKDRQIVNQNYIQNIIGSQTQFELKTEKYQVRIINIDRKHYAFIPHHKTICSFIQKQRDEKLYAYFKEIILQFKLTNRNKLLQALYESESDLNSCINAFTEYTFSNRYAFWIYNSYTKHFSCLTSSHQLTKEFINEKDNSYLFQFLKDNKHFISRTPKHDCVNHEIADSMNTINRLRIDFDDKSEVGIVDFFSAYPDFKLREKTLKWIHNCLKTKYLEYGQRSQSIALQHVEEYFSTYKTGTFHEFMYGLVNKISEELCFQACSIFIKVRDKAMLELVAVSDKEQHGKPVKKIEYDLKKKTFTGSTFNSAKIQFSYDIENDPENSNTYNETTEGKGKTWIAFPLIAENIVWGVLRVKNKYMINDKKKLVNLQASDFKILESVCVHLSNIYSIEQAHERNTQELHELENSKNELLTKYDELTNFYNVFLHEIRTPISTFSTSTARIKNLLNRPKTDDNLNSILNKVDDIRIMGERLIHITNTYYFREIVKTRKNERLSVMADIILPVINISKDYLKRQYDVDILIDENNILGSHVYGDKMLLNIVFNSLISNAGKYSPRSYNPIIVSGEYDEDGDYYYIIVSNWGFHIHEDEKELIFKNRERGREIKKQKIGGTGIGLFLSKEIMKEQNGDLILTSLKNPVTFKIKIPVKYY